MPYPWPSFGSRHFASTEQPIYQTDTGWVVQPALSKTMPLGGATTDVVILGVGSLTRLWEAHFTVDAFEEMEALHLTTALLTDWERPTPDSRQALFEVLEPVDIQVIATGANGRPERRIRARLGWLSQ